MDSNRRFRLSGRTSTYGTESTSKRRSQDRVPVRSCASSVGEPPAEEDRRLANWRKWLSDRKRLEQRLGRPPQDLQLNAHERVRARNERRCLLEAAGKSEITSQDRYRGNPAFWRTEDEGIQPQMDRAARNLPPDIERVALPEIIRREKGLLDSHLDGTGVRYCN